MSVDIFFFYSFSNIQTKNTIEPSIFD